MASDFRLGQLSINNIDEFFKDPFSHFLYSLFAIEDGAGPPNLHSVLDYWSTLFNILDTDLVTKRDSLSDGYSIRV